MGGLVYTVVGEGGNSEVAYARELPSLAAALEAIRAGRLPGAPLSRDGGPSFAGGRVGFTVSRPHCYHVIGHEPERVVGHTVRGGRHQGRREFYDLDAGNFRVVGPSGEASGHWPRHPAATYVSGDDVFADVAGVPPEWVAYCRRLLAARRPEAHSVFGDAERALGVTW